MWKASVKTILLGLYVHLWAPLRNLSRRLRGRCHTTVLLYHRVSDQFEDGMTVGVEQFRRQLRMLQQHYDVVDMRTFLDSRHRPIRRPRVVLTFDDGYADNHAAARLLLQERMPCTFFVSTGIVGTPRTFPGDCTGNRRAPALSWTQVEQMSRWGFDVANHTVNHPDLGREPLESALDEIRNASRHLVQRLGATGAERWLAYPFGRRRNITAEVAAALGSVGIDYCFSAHGGTNPPAFDPTGIRRQGVGAGVSDLRLRASIEGWSIAGPERCVDGAMTSLEHVTR